ncbi:TPA: preprotein translocase subunit SecE [Candidatus Avigastranaerophilus faecigallinarum]|nr:preprotein translocase subunit SecE [Candidatus Avigastranaerophilus faecigallinarum]
MEKIVTYFKGVKAEWGKITWPEKKQVISQTIVVLVIVIAFTIYTYGLDLLFKFIVPGLGEFLKNIFRV